MTTASTAPYEFSYAMSLLRQAIDYAQAEGDFQKARLMCDEVEKAHAADTEPAPVKIDPPSPGIKLRREYVNNIYNAYKQTFGPAAAVDLSADPDFPGETAMITEMERRLKEYQTQAKEDDALGEWMDEAGAARQSARFGVGL